MPSGHWNLWPDSHAHFPLDPSSAVWPLVTYHRYTSKSKVKSLRPAESVQFSHSVVSNSLRPHELQHARPPCPSPTPGVHSNSRSSSMPSPARLSNTQAWAPSGAPCRLNHQKRPPPGPQISSPQCKQQGLAHKPQALHGWDQV